MVTLSQSSTLSERPSARLLPSHRTAVIEFVRTIDAGHSSDAGSVE